MCNSLKQDILIRFLDNELDPIQKESVSNHLKNCPLCRENLAELKWKIKTINFGLEQIAADVSAIPSMEQIIDLAQRTEDREKQIAIDKPWLKPLIALAASIVLLIGGWSVLYKDTPIPEVEFYPETVQELSIEDPNQMWHNRQLNIVVMDENGKILNSIISSKSNLNNH
jgi:predicted anti-sigma-YlaC factor YlaD